MSLFLKEWRKQIALLICSCCLFKKRIRSIFFVISLKFSSPVFSFLFKKQITLSLFQKEVREQMALVALYLKSKSSEERNSKRAKSEIANSLPSLLPAQPYNYLFWESAPEQFPTVTLLLIPNPVCSQLNYIIIYFGTVHLNNSQQLHCF